MTGHNWHWESFYAVVFMSSLLPDCGLDEETKYRQFHVEEQREVLSRFFHWPSPDRLAQEDIDVLLGQLQMGHGSSEPIRSRTLGYQVGG